MQSNSNPASSLAPGSFRPKLSARQLECLAWAQEGKSAGDIGQIIGISGRTVEGHLAKACEALGVRTRVQAVVRARELGLLGGRVEGDALPSAERTFRSARRG
jgi:DNA-binding CsgD family transcriptional regulator